MKKSLGVIVDHYDDGDGNEKIPLRPFIYLTIKYSKQIYSLYFVYFAILCFLMCILTWPAWYEVYWHRLHLWLCVFLWFNRLLNWGDKFTLVTFVRLYSGVYFCVPPKMAASRSGKVTLVTFVGFLPTVCNHVCLQITLCRRGIFTLITFVRPFSRVYGFHMVP